MAGFLLQSCNPEIHHLKKHLERLGTFEVPYRSRFSLVLAWPIQTTPENFNCKIIFVLQFFLLYSRKIVSSNDNLNITAQNALIIMAYQARLTE